jgi:phosphate uptake regulator
MVGRERGDVGLVVDHQDARSPRTNSFEEDLKDATSQDPAMSLFLVSRNLERIADLATNIAEDVVFMVEGCMIKHHRGAGTPPE